MIATVVDTTALWQTAVSALAAGIGITAVFSLVILGAARMSEASRDGRTVAATLYAGLALLSLIGTAAAVVIGVVVMSTK